MKPARIRYNYESGGWVFESPRARQSHDKEQAQARFIVDSFMRLRSSNLSRLTDEVAMAKLELILCAQEIDYVSASWVRYISAGPRL